MEQAATFKYGIAIFVATGTADLTMPLYMITGAYEPPKAAKQRATITYTRVPLKYKFILSKYGKCASIGNSY